MVRRCLFLLLTEVTRTPDSPSPKRVVPVQFTTSLTSDFNYRTYRDLFILIHALRLVQYALRRVIPACDRDLPLRVCRVFAVRPIGTVGQPDVSQTIRSGLLSTGRAIFLDTVKRGGTPEIREIQSVLSATRRAAIAALFSVNPDYLARNRSVRSLVERLHIATSELEHAVARRPLIGWAERPEPLNIRRLKSASLYRSVRYARILARLLDSFLPTVAPGGEFTESLAVEDNRLYEFWCFAEFTMRLLETGRYRVLQKSLLRTGDTRAVFTFGSDCYVYFEHRRNYFHVDGATTVRAVHKWEKGRGPEWFLLRGRDLSRSVVIDCKYYQSHRAGLMDSTNMYCTQYGAGTGVSFIGHPPRRKGVIVTDPQRYREEHASGLGGLRLFKVRLVPREDCSKINRESLDWLISRLGLGTTE